LITVLGRQIDVDIRAELEQYDWVKPRWTADKLIAASPFRYDRTPSFFVSLEHGGWKDSGSVDPEWSSGNILKLLAYIQKMSYSDVCDYLLMRYDSIKEYDYGKLSINLSIRNLCSENKQTLDISILDGYKFRHPYLSQRGISEAVQRMFRIGYDKRSKAVTIPWFTADGKLANVKYRRTDSKIFWYAKGGMPLRGLIFGMDQIYKYGIKKAVIVESEIDAMYIYTAFPGLVPIIGGIAIGGSAFTQEKADLIKRSPIEKLLLATDNDAVGQKIREEVKRKLAGSVALADVEIPERYKDVNDIKDLEELKTCLSLNKSSKFKIFSG
jgi:DNA primase